MHRRNEDASDMQPLTEHHCTGYAPDFQEKDDSLPIIPISFFLSFCCLLRGQVHSHSLLFGNLYVTGRENSYGSDPNVLVCTTQITLYVILHLHASSYIVNSIE